MDSEQIQNQRQQKQTWEVIGPNTAIDIGYNLYLCDKCTDTQLASSAKMAIAQFNRIAGQMAETTPEGAYYLQIRVATMEPLSPVPPGLKILNVPLSTARGSGP